MPEPDDAVTAPLLTAETCDDLLTRWSDVQVSFVADPRKSIQQAEALIREIGDALAAAVGKRLDYLAEGWTEESDTEALRFVLRQYRSFFGVVVPR
jgi:hypothetical protein